MRHFATRREANKFRDSKNTFTNSMQTFKKLPGHRNRVKKPFVVGTEMEWFVLE